MLLMVPMDAVDALPALRDFLETGSNTASNKKLKQSIAESENRSKSIIDSSVDSIVVTNGQVRNFLIDA
jgi:hypothetical protein